MNDRTREAGTHYRVDRESYNLEVRHTTVDREAYEPTRAKRADIHLLKDGIIMRRLPHSSTAHLTTIGSGSSHADAVPTLAQ